MRTHSHNRLVPLMSSTLLSCALFAGCADAPSVISPTPVGTASSPIVSPSFPAGPTAATDLERLKALSVSSLSPAQGVEDQNLGARVRWAGAVQHLAATNGGVCLTVLYARSDEGSAPRWTNEGTHQSFVACTGGAYDPALISEFTNVTVVGRISGRTSNGAGGGSSSGPVVQIEQLFRWSDCLEGDASLECKYGFISPQTAHVD
ncbi:Outer membrane lipoprotein Slp family protein [compost metagenome]